MITEQQAADIAASAARLKKALHEAGFPAEAVALTGQAMPALVQVVCAAPELAPGAGNEDGGLILAAP
jgi:hypothetical protein